jgi:DNA helicase-2/ATP-dependent DNA helicase PcrA
MKKGALWQVLFEQKMQQQLPNGYFCHFIQNQYAIPCYGRCFKKRDIPYRLYGSLSFLQKEVKDVFAILGKLFNPKDERGLDACD